MSYPSKDQLKDIAEYIGSNLHLPQLIQHFDKSNIYDTEEKLIGQWIDGKPMYQKIITGTTASSKSVFATFDIGAKIDVGMVIFLMVKNAQNTWCSIQSSNSSGETDIDFISITSNVHASSPNKLAIKTGITSCQFIANIQYTKTTDSPVTYIVDDEYEPRVEHCDTFDQNNPSDVTVTFNLGSGSQLIDADELVLYQASSGSFVAVNTVKYNYTFTSIWLDSTAGFMNNTKLEKTPMRIIFNKDGIATKVVDFILPVILK